MLTIIKKIIFLILILAFKLESGGLFSCLNDPFEPEIISTEKFNLANNVLIVNVIRQYSKTKVTRNCEGHITTGYPSELKLQIKKKDSNDILFEKISSDMIEVKKFFQITDNVFVLICFLNYTELFICLGDLENFYYECYLFTYYSSDFDIIGNENPKFTLISYKEIVEAQLKKYDELQPISQLIMDYLESDALNFVIKFELERFGTNTLYYFIYKDRKGKLVKK